MKTYQCQTCGETFDVQDDTIATFDAADWKHYNDNRAAHLNRISVPHVLIEGGN
jgi:hypothetical protein